MVSRDDLTELDSGSSSLASSDSSELSTRVAAVKSWKVSEGVRALATQCARQNTIAEFCFAQSATEQMVLAAEVSRLCLEQCECVRKAVIIAPTVPLAKQYFDIVEYLSGLRVHFVIGDATVDAWEQQQWHEVMSENDILLITPQLFLDVLGAEYVALRAFCLVVVAECQYCSGNHPFAKIFAAHYSRVCPVGQIRVLGLSGGLDRRKVKGFAEREQARTKLAKLMDARVCSFSGELEGDPASLDHGGSMMMEYREEGCQGDKQIL